MLGSSLPGKPRTGFKDRRPAHVDAQSFAPEAETGVPCPSRLKGDAYEGLLERNAQDVKSGAGPVLHPPRA